MNYKKVIFPAFILLVLVQLYVPASMIFQHEEVIKTGKSFKFRTAPIDPYDPFRGKYVRLSYNDNNVVISNPEDWESGEPVYAIISENKDGYAIIQSVVRERPDDALDYFYTQVSHVYFKKLYVKFPFDRFYMEESKAYEAETIHRESTRDTTQVTYAIVKIKDGNAVLENIMINDLSLKESVEQNRE